MIIRIESTAQQEIDRAYLWIARRAPLTAIRWYDRLIEALQSLETLPQRCPAAPESVHFTEVIRHFLYGRGKRRYRVLFVVRGGTVHVIHFRHWARARMRRASIQLPEDDS